MNSVDQFLKQSPRKVFNDAGKFSKTLARFINLPEVITLQNDVQEVAENQKQRINQVIEQSAYRNFLIRKLEEEDERKRKSLSKMMDEKEVKSKINLEIIQRKKEEKSQMTIKHIDEVYKKHTSIEKNKKQQKDQIALKLRESLLNFYEKEHQNKIRSLRKQAQIPSSYQEAVNRIECKQKKSQQHASKSQRQIMMKMAKNSDKNSLMLNLTQVKQMENKKKQQTYLQNCQILSQRQHKYIQSHCNVLESSIKAFETKDTSNEKTKQRIKIFFQERVERWQNLKKRIDDQKSLVSQRCLNVLDRSGKSKFRQTISGFRESGRNWSCKVKQNKSVIYQRDDSARGKILQSHLNYSLKNKSIQKVEEQMDSMKAKALKLSKDFL